MLNFATLVAGLAVLAVIILAAYYAYRTVKSGGCAGCPYSKGDPNCEGCRANDRPIRPE